MSEIKTQKNIGEQIADLLKRQPQNYDVNFSVGPDKIQVKAVKIILKAASPVFEREFVENWESGVMKEGEGIPLPDIDPVLFELFVNLIISDTWAADHLESLYLAHNTVLTLLRLCRRYEILKAIQNLEDAAMKFIISCPNYKDSEEFLGLSQENVETVFSCEGIPFEEIDIFDCACRWAEHQCEQKKIEPTGENFRQVLGSSLFEIRFPTMKFEDFTQVSRFEKNLFSLVEKVSIYDFIGMKEAEKANYDLTHLPFKKDPRKNRKQLEGLLVLRLPQRFVIKANSTFVCDGKNRLSNGFQVNRKILLQGVGFLGPTDRDANYDVTVSVRQCKNGSTPSDIGTFKRNIFARKGKLFHFFFDKPITIELSTTYDSSWKTFYYFFCYSLKGAENVPHYSVEVDSSQDGKLEVSGVKFYLHKNWNTGSPIAELLWTKI